MNSMQKHIHYLAVTIGPRGSASKNEAKSATYIQEKLSNLGYAVTLDPFSTINSFSPVQLILIGGFVLSSSLFLIQPIIAGIVAIVFLSLYMLDINTRFSIAHFLPKKQSQNVRAQLPASLNTNGTIRTKVVIMAHYDSSKAGLNFHPRLVAGFRNSFLLIVTSMVMITLCTVLGAIAMWQGRTTMPFFYALTPFAIYLFVVTVMLIHRELFGNVTPGANDNASGVSVLLGVAKELIPNPPQHIDIEFLATGAEEAGMFGSLNYIKNYGIVNTLFINLDNLGTGDLFITTSDGALRKFSVDPKLLAITQECIYTAPTLPVACHGYHLLATDATPILARGGQAISIMAQDKQGLLPNWHWNTDTVEHISSSNLNTAKQLVLRMIKSLDRPT